MINGILFMCAVVAVISFTAAYGLDSKYPATWWKRRAAIAAVIGGMLPMALLSAAFLLSGDPRAERVGTYVVLIGLGLIVSGLVGYPVAYLFTRRCERSREVDFFK